MKTISTINIISITVLASLTTFLSKSVGTECTLAEPGGVSNGWQGFPVPFSFCGAWGESMNVPLLLLNLLVWWLLILGVFELIRKFKSKKRSA